MLDFDELAYLRSKIEARCQEFRLDSHETSRLLQPGLGSSASAAEAHIRIVDEMLTLLMLLYSVDDAQSWLRTSNSALGGRAPLALASMHIAGLREVRAHLRLMHDVIYG
jgi:hypothetical protein